MELTEIYERNINSRVRIKGQNFIIVRTSLLDLDHNIVMDLKINLKTKQIEDSHVEMVKVPETLCKNALLKIKNLKGLKIEKGISKLVAKGIGGCDGCTHIVEIAMSSIRTASNVMLTLDFIGQDISKEYPQTKGVYKKAKDHLKGTCVAFK